MILKRALSMKLDKIKKQLSLNFSCSPHFDLDTSHIWDFNSSVEQYSVIGGTSKASVAEQIKKLQHFVVNFSA